MSILGPKNLELGKHNFNTVAAHGRAIRPPKVPTFRAILLI